VEQSWILKKTTVDGEHLVDKERSMILIGMQSAHVLEQVSFRHGNQSAVLTWVLLDDPSTFVPI